MNSTILRPRMLAFLLSCVLAGCGSGGGTTDPSLSGKSAQTAETASGASAPSSEGTVANPEAGSPAGLSAPSGETLAMAVDDSATIELALLEKAKMPLGIQTLNAPLRKRSGVGTNLEAVTYWMTSFPFINQMKTASPWFTSCTQGVDAGCSNFTSPASSWDTQEQARLDLDADGYVKSLPAASDSSVKFRYAQALLFQGNDGQHLPGKYIVLYDGEGDIAYSLAGRKVAAESRPGRDVVDITNMPRGAGVSIAIKSTKPGNHIRNIRVIPPGGVCASSPNVYRQSSSECPQKDFTTLEARLAAGETFHPAFIDALSGFRVARFMEWLRSNESTVDAWSRRPLPSNATWTGTSGVPVEVALDLARKTGVDPWINIPARVDDAYATQLGAMIKQKLAGTQATVYIEYGNEPWNYASVFGVMGALHEARAVARWGASAASTYELRLNGYAWRAGELCRLVKAAAAGGPKVQCALNSQAFNTGVSEVLLKCPLAARELGAACNKVFDLLAVAPYFGGYVFDSANANVFQAWSLDTSGGVAALLSELSGTDASGKAITAPMRAAGLQTPAQGAIADAARAMRETAAIATRYGIPMVAYEGGQHLAQGPHFLTPEIQNLAFAANRSKIMGDLYTRHLDTWRAAGGQLYIQYNMISAWTRWGTWGMKESLFSTDPAPKWDAVKAYNANTACWWAGC